MGVKKPLYEIKQSVKLHVIVIFWFTFCNNFIIARLIKQHFRNFKKKINLMNTFFLVKNLKRIPTLNYAKIYQSGFWMERQINKDAKVFYANAYVQRALKMNKCLYTHVRTNTSLSISQARRGALRMRHHSFSYNFIFINDEIQNSPSIEVCCSRLNIIFSFQTHASTSQQFFFTVC